MRILVLAALLLPAAAIAADRDPARPVKQCKAEPQRADTAAPKPNRPQKLNELPKAEGYLAVLHIDNGCEKPIKVRESRR